jgi:hypothetical protein
MSEETRWRFKVLDVPKPAMSGTAYKWGFTGMGFAVGAIWTTTLIDTLGRSKADLIIFSVAALIFIWQGIYLHRESKRIARETEAMRARMIQFIGPELTDEERGDASHGDK